jgi:hypothetical protein
MAGVLLRVLVLHHPMLQFRKARNTKDKRARDLTHKSYIINRAFSLITSQWLHLLTLSFQHINFWGHIHTIAPWNAKDCRQTPEAGRGKEGFIP